MLSGQKEVENTTRTKVEIGVRANASVAEKRDTLLVSALNPVTEIVTEETGAGVVPLEDLVQEADHQGAPDLLEDPQDPPKDPLVVLQDPALPRESLDLPSESLAHQEETRALPENLCHQERVVAEVEIETTEAEAEAEVKAMVGTKRARVGVLRGLLEVLVVLLEGAASLKAPREERDL